MKLPNNKYNKKPTEPEEKEKRIFDEILSNMNDVPKTIDYFINSVEKNYS